MVTTSRILAGAAISCAGIIVAAAGQGTAGGLAVVSGWLVLVASIHRYGRGDHRRDSAGARDKT